MDRDPAPDGAIEPPEAPAEPGRDAAEPETPVMLTDAMCGCACQVKPETRLA